MSFSEVQNLRMRNTPHQYLNVIFLTQSDINFPPPNFVDSLNTDRKGILVNAYLPTKKGGTLPTGKVEAQPMPRAGSTSGSILTGVNDSLGNSLPL